MRKLGEASENGTGFEKRARKKRNSRIIQLFSRLKKTGGTEYKEWVYAVLGCLQRTNKGGGREWGAKEVKGRKNGRNGEAERKGKWDNAPSLQTQTIHK